MSKLTESGQAGADDQRTEVVITPAMVEAAARVLNQLVADDGFRLFSDAEIGRQILQAALLLQPSVSDRCD